MCRYTYIQSSILPEYYYPTKKKGKFCTAVNICNWILQVSRLRNQNNQMVANMNVAANLCVRLEAENSILRTQMTELTYRLESLNDIVMFLNSTAVLETFDLNGFEDEDNYCNPWGSPFAN